MKAKTPNPIFISKEGIATFWFVVAALVMVGSGVYAERQAATRGLRPQFIIMDHEGSLVRQVPAQPMTDPEAQHELLVAQTRLLLDSVYNKTSSGLDAADRCQRMMTPEAWQWVKEHLVEPQSEAFVEGRLHQKVAVESIDVEVNPEEQTAAAGVVGQLIRTGILHGELFNQVWSLKGTIVWEHNPCLRDCGRFPVLCSSFACQETPVSTTQRQLTREEETSLRGRAAVESAAEAPPGRANPPTKP